MATKNLDEKWIKVRVMMLKNGTTFAKLGKKHGITRQRVHQIIRAGYPATGRAKRVLDDFYRSIAA